MKSTPTWMARVDLWLHWVRSSLGSFSPTSNGLLVWEGRSPPNSNGLSTSCERICMRSHSPYQCPCSSVLLLPRPWMKGPSLFRILACVFCSWFEKHGSLHFNMVAFIFLLFSANLSFLYERLTCLPFSKRLNRRTATSLWTACFVSILCSSTGTLTITE